MHETLMPLTLTAQIKQAARDLGFDVVGISRLSTQKHEAPSRGQHTSPDSLLTRLTEWLQRGFHATMAWMARDPQRRTDPALVLPGCRSILSLGMNYYTDERADERQGNGRIARYAWGRDYHDILGDRLGRLAARLSTLAPGHNHRAYVDTGPVMEKAWAQQAGLGWIGKHSNLVSAEFGSWLLLGEILTTVELEPDEAGTDLCGSCTLCIQACPTGAITEPYVVDAGRCISYLTIELRGSEPVLSEELRRGIGNRIFGCDDCLDICPYNHQAMPTNEPGFQPSSLTTAPNLTELADMDEQTFMATFSQSPIKRAKYSGFRRNLSWASANNPAPPPTSPR
ncbi:Epoxyqueuosine reductase [Nitrospira defluvii]|uniref:Epoxyqueuosine reductase n=2 Tax=Nitrospira defluvii TaxID=330214 RepID=A0ABM8QCN3_9BACT|nr:Epoxyqueuosine reductase [Nitrospira defluvii]